jgi:hypothetical protein
VVHFGRGHDAVEQGTDPVGVETSGEQLDVAWLAGQDVDELEPLREAVLEVGELVDEHHGVRAAVAVQQGHARVLFGQQRRHDGERGGDA